MVRDESVYRMELLCPAKGPRELNAALAAGGDAIYCGYGTTFNARRGAESFNAETFADATRRSHVAGARIYVTVNVVVKDAEMSSVLALIRRAWLAGADAFIIQDLGLMYEVSRLWPEIEIHVSTQGNVHDTRGVLFCREAFGVARVTLSRELTFQEIATIADTGVDVECFGHGALCFCYSGICQLSSCGGARSANRGACAQPCRLPYELVDEAGRVISAPDRGRPLCPKDCCTLDVLDQMRDAHAASLKVEGRLKGPDYVYAVTHAYRGAIDDLEAGITDDKADARRRRLVKRAFNRDFTHAYLDGTSGDEMMSYERSNNRGELVGTVVDSRSYGSVKVRRGGGGGGRERLRTAHVAEADILLDEPVGKGDLLELRPITDPSQFLTTTAPADAVAGATITVKTTRTLESGSLVRVIRSQAALDAGERAADERIARRREVAVSVTAHIGEPFRLEMGLCDGSATVVVEGFVVERARTRAVSVAELEEHVGRMGQTPFEMASFSCEVDEGIGMAFSAVHRLRADACDLLEQEILAPYAERTLGAVPSREDIVREATTHGRMDQERAANAEVSVLVSCPEAAERALDAGATFVYAMPDALSEGTWPEGTRAYLDEVCREIDHDRIDPFVVADATVCCGNVSEVRLARERGAHIEIGPTIPVHNQATLATLSRQGAGFVWLSPEVSIAEATELSQADILPLGVMVSGRVRAMTCEHCILQVADRCIHDCAHCGLRRRKNYLKGQEGERYPVTTDLEGRSRLYAAEVLDATPQIAQYLQAGIRSFCVDATLLETDEVATEVAYVVSQARAAERGARLRPRRRGCTSGHLFAPIE